VELKMETLSKIILSSFSLLFIASCGEMRIIDAVTEKEISVQNYIKLESFSNIPFLYNIDADHRENSGTNASIDVSWNINVYCKNYKEFSTNKITRAYLKKNCPDDDVNWISIAISGGGTKSAVYSMEVLHELQTWGLLPHADVISSVSGGSFTAAAYTLTRDCSSGIQSDDILSNSVARPCWSRNEANKAAQADLFWIPLLISRLQPFGIAQRMFTDRDLSDHFSDFVERHVLNVDGHTKTLIGDLNPRRPNLILNSTNLNENRKNFHNILSNFDESRGRSWLRRMRTEGINS
jgi:hypothetical protein